MCVCVCQLMKLNEEWDHIYHSTSVGLQQRVAALEEESRALKQLNSRLLLKVEHEEVCGQKHTLKLLRHSCFKGQMCIFSVSTVSKQNCKYCLFT